MKINLLAKNYRILIFFTVISTIVTFVVFSRAPLSEASISEEAETPPSEFLNTSLKSITTTLFSDEQFTNYETIPFETVYQDDPELEIGNEIVVQIGKPGQLIENFIIHYYEGEEVARDLISTETVPSEEEIIRQGTKIVIREIETPIGILKYMQKLSVYSTPYTLDSAGGSGYTATGTIPHFGTVAVDPTVIPLGTRMYIPGYGIGIAEDTGGAIKGNIIDLFYEGDHGWWESKYIDIYILVE